MTVRIAAAAFAAAAFTLAAAGTASADSTALRWRVTGPAATSRAGSGELYAADRGSTVVARTVVDGVATLIDFAGWRGTSFGDVLSPTASILSTDPDFAEDSGGGSDGADTSFDPESAAFAISVWVRPTRAPLFPRGTLNPSAVSPNIAQKGRMNTVGGYWKVSTKMAHTPSGMRWAPLCTFRSAAGEMLNVNASSNGQVLMMDQTAGYTIVCALNRGTATMTMTPAGGVAQTRSLVATGPFSVSNDAAVSVGHLPMTTSATDMYDGLLARLTISKS